MKADLVQSLLGKNSANDLIFLNVMKILINQRKEKRRRKKKEFRSRDEEGQSDPDSWQFRQKQRKLSYLFARDENLDK